MTISLRLNPKDEKLIKTYASMKHMSVSEVAYDVGFSAPSYFTKCFTNEFGIAPKQFVQEHNGHV